MVLGKDYLQPAVVLVTDRTLSGDYKILFEGIFATMQTTQVPEFAMRSLVSPKIKVDERGRAKAAALGIRRMESALIDHGGFSADDVVCTTPEALGDLLGPWVKVVGVSSSDPLGRGMSNTTTANFWKGELYPKFWLDRMMGEIRQAKEKHGFKVVGGGAGAWQWVLEPGEAERQGFDHIFEGYGETAGVELIKDLLEGKAADYHVTAKDTSCAEVCAIKGASMLGIVELSRGCGKGCRYCTAGRMKMGHLGVDTIVSDLERNVAGGITSMVSGSEDLFRYGGKAGKVEFEELRKLLEAMREVEGLSFMQIDHANVSSIMQMSDEELQEVRRLLTWREATDYLWVNMGVESANGHLVKANSGGKLGEIGADDWEEAVRESVERMTRTGFFSVVSLILGLPGETPEDVERTVKLVDYLEGQRAVIFPIFYEPIRADDEGDRFTVKTMRLDHLDLYQKCYEINFRWVPRLFWDNQRAGGVSLTKRSLMRLLGKTEVRAWRKTFGEVRGKIEDRRHVHASVGMAPV